MQLPSITGVRRLLPQRLTLGAAALSLLAASVLSSAAWADTANTTGLAVTDTTVTVGQLHSATGTMAISETGSIQAERLAIEQINAAGGSWADRSKWCKKTVRPTGRPSRKKLASCW